jgi:preprotein translocase subunit YajC
MEQMLLPILMFAALGAMMYFGMRKQKRQVAETRRMQDSVVPGARVMTTSGLHGEVTAVADDTIELEIAPGIRTTWVRAAVREIVVPTTTPSLEDSLDVDGVRTDGLSETGEVSLDKRQSGSTDIG